MIRNGLKTFAGNFMLVWKHAMYLLISFSVAIGLFVWSSIPIVDRLRESGWIEEMYNFFELFYTDPSLVASGFGRLAESLYDVLFTNVGVIWGNYALSLFLLLIVPSFLYYFGEYVLGVTSGARMSTLMNVSYTNKLISTSGRSSLYALLKILLTIPFVIMSISVCFIYGYVANIINNAWIILPAFIIIELFILAIKYVFFIGFLPEAVMSGDRLIKAFARGVSAYTSQFFKKVLYVWAVFIVQLAGILFIGIFTLGAGLIIAVPAIMVINVSVSFANFFQTRHESYYCAENVIIKPIENINIEEI